MTIGERIKQRRKKLGLTQTALADLAGTTKQNIYKYENGIIKNIPSDRLAALAKALQTSPAALNGWGSISYNLIFNVDTEMTDEQLDSFIKNNKIKFLKHFSQYEGECICLETIDSLWKDFEEIADVNIEIVRDEIKQPPQETSDEE
jgi:transcriptional regulator with XRE-family HTH domain